MHNKKMLSNIILTVTAIIWGTAFVAQRVGMEKIGPVTYNAVRYVLSTVFIFIIILIRNTFSKNNKTEKQPSADKDSTLKGIITCGLILFVASNLQQAGLVFTTAGKAAFITTLYILLIPIIGIFIGMKTNFLTWLAVAVGALGLFFLSISDSFSIQKGDLIVMIGALFWAFHVIFIDKFLIKGVDPLVLSCGQLGVVAVLSTIMAFVLETPNIAEIKDAWFTIAYAGIMSGGVGYTGQILGQRYAKPVIASLILSTESAFGAIAGAIILNEIMSGRELLGAVLMFVAVILSQVKLKPKETL